jgi:hypothetical protein
MRHFLDFLHILFAVFAIGPLVHAATTASRGIRHGNRDEIAGSARTLKIYAGASVLVVIFGMSLVQSKYHHEFSDTWIWLSVVIWAVLTGLVVAVLIPGLGGAGRALEAGQPAGGFIARVAAAGGLVGIGYAVIVALMIWKPGA